MLQKTALLSKASSFEKKKHFENDKDCKQLLFDILAATLEREVQLEIWKLKNV